LSSLAPKQLFRQLQLFQNIKKAPADIYRTPPFDYYDQDPEGQVKSEKSNFVETAIF
jgi:hypothetical protein